MPDISDHAHELAEAIMAADDAGDHGRAQELLAELSRESPLLVDILFSADHGDDGELDIEEYPMPPEVAALFAEDQSAQLAAGQECGPGERSDLTGCIPGEAAPKKESQKAARASIAHDVIGDLGIEPGEKLPTDKYREAVAALGEAGVDGKQAKAILSLYEGGVPAMERAKRKVLAVKDKVQSSADGIAAKMEAAGVPAPVAKTAAWVAAIDMASPMTLTSLGLTAALGPVAAMKVPIYYLPGMAEAGAVLASTVVGSRAASTIAGVTKRQLKGPTA